jgi:hypothetical protein
MTGNAIRGHTLNGLKAVALGLFAIHWAFIVALLVFARDLYDTPLAGQLSQFMRLSGDTRPAEIATLLALSALPTLLAIGIIRAWRWTFWLILVAFLAGIARPPPRCSSPEYYRSRVPHGMWRFRRLWV